MIVGYVPLDLAKQRRLFGPPLREAFPRGDPKAATFAAGLCLDRLAARMPLDDLMNI